MREPTDVIGSRPRVQCADLAGDRELGAFWEREFCKIAAKYGRSFTPHQLKRAGSAQAFGHWQGKYHPMTLPDVTVWTRPGEHHEIKHKDPTSRGFFGLERYRLDALLWFAAETGQSVYYTIHDYSMQPNPSRAERKHNKKNIESHWLYASIAELADSIAFTDHGDTYYNSGTALKERCYWHRDQFRPLTWLWQGEPQRDMFGRLEH